MSSLGIEASMGSTWAKFAVDLLEPELAPMLSPARYMRLLSMDAETLAQNAQVSVSAITNTPDTANIQEHLRDNLRVLKAAYDAAGGDLAKTLHWFRGEPLPAFRGATAEQTVVAGRTDDVIRFIDSLYAGAAS